MSKRVIDPNAEALLLEGFSTCGFLKKSYVARYPDSVWGLNTLVERALCEKSNTDYQLTQEGINLRTNLLNKKK